MGLAAGDVDSKELSDWLIRFKVVCILPKYGECQKDWNYRITLIGSFDSPQFECELECCRKVELNLIMIIIN